MKYFLFLLVLVSLSIYTSPSRCFAQTDSTHPEAPPAFEMGTPDLTPGLLPQIDSIVTFAISFTSRVSDTAKVRLHFPGHIAPANKLPNEIFRDTLIPVLKDSTYTFYFPMKIFAYGSSLIEAFVQPLSRHYLDLT